MIHLIPADPTPVINRASARLGVAEEEATYGRQVVRIDLPPRDGLGKLIGHYLAVHPQDRWHSSYPSGDGFLYLEWARDEVGWTERSVSRDEVEKLLEAS